MPVAYRVFNGAGKLLNTVGPSSSNYYNSSISIWCTVKPSRWTIRSGVTQHFELALVPTTSREVPATLSNTVEQPSGHPPSFIANSIFTMRAQRIWGTVRRKVASLRTLSLMLCASLLLQGSIEATLRAPNSDNTRARASCRQQHGVQLALQYQEHRLPLAYGRMILATRASRCKITPVQQHRRPTAQALLFPRSARSLRTAELHIHQDCLS